MWEHIDNLDNRGRRCNVRVTGLPENTEGSDPVNFSEKWVPEYLQMTTKDSQLKLDRAHRSLAPKPSPNQRPRPLILKFHNFQDKQWTMEAASRLGSCESDQDAAPREPKVFFFNDYSAEVVRGRKAFDNTKTRLKKMNMDYALLDPATLRVTVDGKQKRVDSPENAELLVQSLEQRRKGTSDWHGQTRMLISFMRYVNSCLTVIQMHILFVQHTIATASRLKCMGFFFSLSFCE